ncbi:MAG TPA: aldo/keto reductase [Actinomycetota bacterium]|nr:aldo/keto reductase [Actinomycetota bacterium]
MRQRRIGSTDLVASEVGLAVWSLVAGPGARSDEDAADLLGAARDLGITYLAATDSDDDGRAEELLGQAARGHRDELTVATTFGYDTTPRPWAPDPTAPRHDWSPAFAGRALDRSLLRLRLEPVDLWLLHHPGMDAVESDELFELLEAQVAKGKIRAYGVALGPGPGWGDEGAAALGERRVAAVETVYNVAEPSPGSDLATLAAETGAGLVARDPLAPRLPAAARRRLDFLERDRDQTLDQALLRLALAEPGVATTLPAVADRGHLAELAGAADLPPPTAEDLDRLAELREAGFGLDSRTAS